MQYHPGTAIFKPQLIDYCVYHRRPKELAEHNLNSVKLEDILSPVVNPTGISILITLELSSAITVWELARSIEPYDRGMYEKRGERGQGGNFLIRSLLSINLPPPPPPSPLLAICKCDPMLRELW